MLSETKTMTNVNIHVYIFIWLKFTITHCTRLQYFWWIFNLLKSHFCKAGILVHVFLATSVYFLSHRIILLKATILIVLILYYIFQSTLLVTKSEWTLPITSIWMFSDNWMIFWKKKTNFDEDIDILNSSNKILVL